MKKAKVLWKCNLLDEESKKELIDIPRLRAVSMENLQLINEVLCAREEVRPMKVNSDVMVR